MHGHGRGHDEVERRADVVAAVIVATLLGSCAGAHPTASASSGTGGASPSTPPTLAWDVRDAPGVVEDAVAAAGGIVAVGGSVTMPTGAGEPRVWRSSDGVAWEAATVPGKGRMTAVTATDDGSLVAVGEWAPGEATTGVSWVSKDGAAWTASGATAGLGPATGCTSTMLDDVASGQGRFVAVGTEWGCGGDQHAAAWWSSDGLTWSRATVPAGGHSMLAVVATEVGWAASGASIATDGEGMHGAFWFTADGRAWTQAEAGTSLRNAQPSAIAVDNRGLAAVGTAISERADGSLEAVAWRSSDGRTWQRLPAAGMAWTPDDAAPAARSPAQSAQPSAAGRVTLVLADGLIATDGGLVVLGAARAAGSAGQTDPAAAWRYLVWTAPTDGAWRRLPSGGALTIGAADSYLGGPSAALIHNQRLLLFGATVGPSSPSLPGAGTPRIWSVDALALGLGPGVLTNAWWKRADAGETVTAAPDAGGPLSSRNCPTLGEAKAATSLVTGGPDANAVPFKTMELQCSYALDGVDAQGRPAGVGILVFDAGDRWQSVRSDPSFPNPKDVAGLGDVAFATGEAGHQDLWVTAGRWQFHMSSLRKDGVPLDALVALARATLVTLERPPR